MSKLLTTAQEMVKVLRDAMGRYQEFRWSIAWASSGFPLFEELLKKRKRIVQVAVGVHFYQTHPEFLERFVGDPAVHVILQPSGVFHPKIYFFENGRDDWACVIGSPNFTKSAFSENVEVAVYLDNASAGADGTYDVLRGVIEEHWKKGEPITKARLDAYWAIWKRKRQLIDQLAGTYGGKGGKPIVSVEVLGLSWPEFVGKVRSEKEHSLSDRVAVLRGVRTYFQDNKHLSQCGKTERRRIAGLSGEDQGTDWGYFGSMKGAGRLWTAIDSNDQHLSAALDAIPADDRLVSRNDYQAFVDKFKLAFPNVKGDYLAPATRLLCMKRPDMFVCLDSKNRAGLCKAFGIAQSDVSYARYWSEVIERVRDAVWWNAPRPSGDEEEEEIWRGRTAFLDALYYKA